MNILFLIFMILIKSGIVNIQKLKPPLIFTRKQTSFVLWPGVEETDLSLRS